jgi:DNA-binding LacI/PurR family transcriptional regulator
VARRRSPSIRDIAARAGVDASTVSLALNGSPKVATTTRDRILGIARELDYRPNILARALRGGRTRSIGILVASLDLPFFVDLLKAQERWLFHQGYTALLSVLHGKAGEQTNILDDLQTRLVDGICVGFPSGAEVDAYRAVAGRGMPMSFYSEQSFHPAFADVAANFALCDLADGVSQLVGFLAELGHRRIAYVGYVHPRESEFQQAMASHGLTVPDELLFKGDRGEESLAEIAVAMQAMASPPTALVVQSDEMASGLVRCLMAQGASVPRDISVVGINNSSYAVSAPVPLTTLSLPVRRMGEWMVQRLVDQIEKRSPEPTVEVFPADVVVRESTAGPPGRV